MKRDSFTRHAVMAGYSYEYRCPTCGTHLHFKMRVTQTKRKCPQCGTPITPDEIDRQAAAQMEAYRQQKKERERQQAIQDRQDRLERKKLLMRQQEEQQKIGPRDIIAWCGVGGLVIIAIALLAIAITKALGVVK